MAKTAKNANTKTKVKKSKKEDTKTRKLTKTGKVKKGAKVNKMIEAKKAESAKKLAALKKKPKDELTPIEKAQLARAANKGKPGKKKARMTFKAPADMKPVSIRAGFAIGKDGHMTFSKIVAIKGKVDSDTAKVIDLNLYDQVTHNAVIARIAGPIFVKSEKKRLPAGLQVQALFRVGKSSKHGGVITSLKEVKVKLPEKKQKTLAKKDPFYRVIRKSARPLEAAFTKMKDFPSTKEFKALTAIEESEE